MRKKFSLKRMIVITDILIKLFHLHFSCKKVVEDSKENLKVIKNICQINQKILKVSKSNHSSWKALQLMCT